MKASCALLAVSLGQIGATSGAKAQNSGATSTWSDAPETAGINEITASHAQITRSTTVRTRPSTHKRPSSLFPPLSLQKRTHARSRANTHTYTPASCVLRATERTWQHRWNPVKRSRVADGLNVCRASVRLRVSNCLWKVAP